MKYAVERKIPVKPWEKLSGIITALFLGISIGKILLETWDVFLHQCPNRDVLSWDANLRLSMAIDIQRDLIQGNFWQGIFPVLHSPTWPPFRLLTSLVFGLLYGSPDPTYEVFLGFAFFILFIISLFYIASKLGNSYFFGAGVFFLSTIMLLQSGELLAYIFSAMLETQGMFFTLWTFYFLYKLYDPESKVKPSLLFASSFGLFFTKYPYGIMLILGIVLFELISRSRVYISLFQFAFANHYGWIRRLILAGIPLLFLLLIVSRYIDLGIDPSSKGAKKIIYPLLFLGFFDFVYMTWRHRKAIHEIVGEGMATIYRAIILPAGVWMILDPDRVMSIVDSQQHVQDASRSFFISIFSSIFDQSIFFMILVLIALGLLLYSMALDSSRGKVLRKDPLYIILGLIITQFIILEFLTGNKQLRHIYHILPVILLFLLSIIYQGLQKMKTSEEKAITPLTFGSILILIGLFLGYQDHGLFSGIYRNERPVCFTGTDRTTIDPARWVAENIESDKRYIVINAFHQQIDRGPGSLLASDMDLLMRFRTWPSGDMRNDSRYAWKSWTHFNRLVYISNECRDPEILSYLSTRAKETGTILGSERTIVDESGQFCLREFEVTPAGGSE